MTTVPPRSSTNPGTLNAVKIAPPSVAIGALPASAGDRMIEALRRAIPMLPEDMRDDVAGLVSPANIAVTAGVFGAWAASHAVGVGELADAGLLALGILTLGSMAFDVAGSIGQFVAKSVNARTGADLDAAAAHIAAAITILGEALFLALIMKFASSRVAGAKPSTIPKDLPRYFALTREEWLYKLGFRRSAPLVRRGAGTALEFFERHQKALRVTDIEGWMKAMDLHSPVTLAGFDTGAELVGYMQVRPNIAAQIKANPADLERILASLKPGDFKIGSFYTKAGTPMERLGIAQQDRVYCRFRVKTPTEALESMTSPARDIWTKEVFRETATGAVNRGQIVGGGATQYLIPEARELFAKGQLELVSSGSGIGGIRPSVQAKRMSLH